MLAIVEGARFGRLQVISELSTRANNGQRVYLCICSCNEHTAATAYSLRSGHTRSCGCLHRDTCAERGRRNRKHGHCRSGSRTPEYFSWQSMLRRCTDPKACNWRWYGGRLPHPVTVCDRWNPAKGGSFQNFVLDLGPRPAGRTLDRFPDPAGNYCPENCRYATPHEQRINQRQRRRSDAAPLIDFIPLQTPEAPLHVI